MIRQIAFSGLLAGALLAGTGLSGCQTTGGDPNDFPRAAPRIPFVPQVRQASIRAAEGRYPNLFTGASHAVWNPGQALPARSAAASMGDKEAGASGVASETVMLEEAMDRDPVPARPTPVDGGLVIECVLESRFPDMSIAYDAVGLRGMGVHLELPDGQEILPAQKVLDPDLDETQEGALRRYRRTLTLHFPRGRFLVENPAANPAARGIRLVLTGHNSIFYFEWPATPDTTVETEARADHQLRERVRTRYNATKDAAKRISHTFD